VSARRRWVRILDRRRFVALSFDDGPHPVWTWRVLAALDSCQAPATFFVHAGRARAYPELVRGAASRGHEIGLHCFRHYRHTRHPRAVIEDDVDRGLEILAQLGIRPKLWRVPWGEEAHFTRTLAAERGLSIVGWTADTNDWRGNRAPAMLGAVAPSLRSGAIVLLHDSIGPGARRTSCGETVRLIQPLVAAVRNQRRTPVTLSEMLRRPAIRRARDGRPGLRATTPP
jgi:peptidoglycan-N-acetylglucosamine deacetylase